MPQSHKKYQKQLQELYGRLSGEIDGLIAAVPENVSATGELSHIPTHNADHDSEGLDKELALIANEEHLLEAVTAALARFDKGTFGRCVTCNEPIPPARLDALPYTPHCVGCAGKPDATE